MPPILYRVLTQIRYQGPVALVASGGLTWVALHCVAASAGIDAIDRATFLSYLGVIATILTLFCSVSLTWVLFVSQQNKSERLSTYDLFKARLSQAQQWLLGLPASGDRELCLAFIYELDKHEMSDLPQTDWGDTYEAYTNALSEALDGDDDDRRHFFQLSVHHFAYIEQLLSRIGLISIRQIITKVFLDTLGKGIALIAIAVLTLVAASYWFCPENRVWLLAVATFVAIGSAFLLGEVYFDIARQYRKELDFVESSPQVDAEV